MADKTAKKAAKKADGKGAKAPALVPYVTEVSVSYGVTLNMGDYESLRADARATVRVDGKPPRHAEEAELLREALFKHAWSTVQSELKEKVKEAKDKQGKRGRDKDREED